MPKLFNLWENKSTHQNMRCSKTNLKGHIRTAYLITSKKSRVIKRVTFNLFNVFHSTPLNSEQCYCDSYNELQLAAIIILTSPVMRTYWVYHMTCKQAVLTYFFSTTFHPSDTVYTFLLVPKYITKEIIIYDENKSMQLIIHIYRWVK